VVDCIGRIGYSAIILDVLESNTMTKTVHLVKFDKGYYAAKQPGYEWSYTDDPLLAAQYKTTKAANERAEWGMGLIRGKCESAVIETYEVVITMKKVG